MQVLFCRGNEGLNSVQVYKEELDEVNGKIRGLRSQILYPRTYLNSMSEYTFKASKLIGIYFLAGILSASWSHGARSLTTLEFWSKIKNTSNAFWGIHSFGGTILTLALISRIKRGVGILFRTTYAFGSFYKKATLNPYKGNVQDWRIHHIEELQKFSYTIAEYCDDPILSQYKCPLSMAPIRFPCTTPLGKIYECETILSWLDNGNNFYPGTRIPLKVEDLSFDGDLYIKIKDRIQELQRSEPFE